jgi:peptidoglycan/xylan/chitin deacetylase (PgdA/CDA1 family)
MVLARELAANVMKVFRAIGLAACFITLLTGVVAQSADKKIPILLYHEVSTPEHPIDITCDVVQIAQFAAQMEYLKSNGYKTISTEDLVNFVSRSAQIPDKSVVIHFDDGRSSVREILPILERFGFKATFWIIAARVGFPGYLDWTDIALLANNPHYEVYSHTLTHPNLATWAAGKVEGKGFADIDRELRESRRLLEFRLGKAVPYLAWPMGAYNNDLIDAAIRAGYVALFTTDRGNNEAGGDVLRIRRSWVAAFHDIDVFASVVQGQIVSRLVSSAFPCSW